MDLGLARYLPEGELAGTACGTRLTMAPEIHLRKKYDHKVEVWSIGCVFFHLITGFYPFNGSDVANLIHNIEEGFYFIPLTVKLTYQALHFLH